ncbi:MAG: hypothetical protein IJX28_03430 [Clostridia bacterium]|nr:hypothetical protein [Clostridia bacterium]
MELEQITVRRAVRVGYQILLRIQINLLLPTNATAIRDFYQTMADGCLRWAEEDYGAQLKAAYQALEDPREKAQQRMQKYHFQMRQCYEADTYIAFLCEGMLTGRWNGAGEGYWRASYVWNKSEQTLLPPSQILALFSDRLSIKRLPFRPDGVYPDGEELIFFRNVTHSTPFEERKIPLEKLQGNQASSQK